MCCHVRIGIWMYLHRKCIPEIWWNDCDTGTFLYLYIFAIAKKDEYQTVDTREAF